MQVAKPFQAELYCKKSFPLEGKSGRQSLLHSQSICEVLGNNYVFETVLSIRAGSRPKQPATGQSLAGYFLLTLLLILVRNLK